MGKRYIYFIAFIILSMSVIAQTQTPPDECDDTKLQTAGVTRATECMTQASGNKTNCNNHGMLWAGCFSNKATATTAFINTCMGTLATTVEKATNNLNSCKEKLAQEHLAEVTQTCTDTTKCNAAPSTIGTGCTTEKLNQCFQQTTTAKEMLNKLKNCDKDSLEKGNDGCTGLQALNACKTNMGDDTCFTKLQTMIMHNAGTNCMVSEYDTKCVAATTAEDSDGKNESGKEDKKEDKKKSGSGGLTAQAPMLLLAVPLAMLSSM